MPRDRGSEGLHETSVVRLDGWAPCAGRRLRGARVPGNTNWAGRAPLATSGRRMRHLVIPISRLRQAGGGIVPFGQNAARSARPHQRGRRRRLAGETAPVHRGTRKPIPIETRSALPSRAADLILRRWVSWCSASARRGSSAFGARWRRGPGEREFRAGAAFRNRGAQPLAPAYRSAAKPAAPGRSVPAASDGAVEPEGSVPRPLMRIREASARRDELGAGRDARPAAAHTGRAPPETRGAAGPRSTGVKPEISVLGAALFRFKESAAFQRRVAHQPRGRNVARVLPAPHQAGNLIGFLQAVHSEAEPVLVAVLARAEVAVAADSQPA